MRILIFIILAFPFIIYGQDGKIQVDSPFSNAEPGETVGVTNRGGKVIKVTNGKPMTWSGKGRSNGGEKMDSPLDPSIEFYCSNCRIARDPTDGNKVVHRDYDSGRYKKNVQYQGVLTGDDGVLYSGQFMNGVPHGVGTLRYSDGAVYKGDFVNGVRTGKGKVTFALDDGSTAKYDGEWVNDFWSGNGNYSNSTVTISGDVFVKGKITGSKAKVESANSNGHYYQGGIKNGQMDGIVTYYSATDKAKGTYIFEKGNLKATMLSKSSMEGLNQIRTIVEAVDLGNEILVAFALYTALTTYDDNPAIFITNVWLTLKEDERGDNFYSGIAAGVRDLNTIKYQQIKKAADFAHFNAVREKKTFDIAFWKRFKLTVKTKSNNGGGGFVPE